MDSNVTLALAKASSIILLSTFETINHKVYRGWMKEERMELEMTGLSSADSLSSKNKDFGVRWGWGWTKWRCAIIFSTMATMRAWLNILSCSMTQAYNVAIVNSLTPLVAPFVQNIVLKTPIPEGLLLSVFVTTVGCVLVGVGQSPYVLGVAARLTYRDGVGCLLQFISVIFSNLARTAMMTSEGVLSKEELVQSQNISSVAFCVIVALTVGGTDVWAGSLDALTKNSRALATFIFLSAGIFTFAATLQVEAVRRLGVSVYGSYR